MLLAKVQLVKSEHLEVCYSANEKVNSVVRTLHALNGSEGLWQATFRFVQSDEGQQLSPEDTYELYNAAYWASIFGDEK